MHCCVSSSYQSNSQSCVSPTTVAFGKFNVLWYPCAFAHVTAALLVLSSFSDILVCFQYSTMEEFCSRGLTVVLFWMHFVFNSCKAAPVNSSCPMDESSWKKAASKFNCTGGEKYSCLFNENNKLVEDCWPPNPVSPGTGTVIYLDNILMKFSVTHQRHCFCMQWYSLQSFTEGKHFKNSNLQNSDQVKINIGDDWFYCLVWENNFASK